VNLPEVLNRTPFEFSPLFLADETGRPLLVCVSRATFFIGESGELNLADAQMKVNPSGEFWDPEKAGSYRYEPDAAFTKLGTDVVLVGHAQATREPTTVMDVGIRVGSLQKVVRVFGDRYWVKGQSGSVMTRPQPFERIPLCYERAFGGWDRTSPDPDQHTFEPRNPVGLGFHGAGASTAGEVRVPNLEDPRAPIADWRDRPMPAGLGFTSPHWQPRAALAGTYDEAWAKTRKPLLPADFDRRFFSAASSGLSVPGYLTGSEPVTVIGCTADGRLDFALPGIGQIEYGVQLRSRPRLPLVAQLDTIVVDSDSACVHLTWRAYTPLRQGAQEVQEIEILGPPEWDRIP
jgi:hypothetical protein